MESNIYLYSYNPPTENDYQSKGDTLKITTGMNK
jgi:hypothetical protein